MKALLFALLCAPLHAQEVVELDAGPIEGEVLDVDSGLRVFRGIPYAGAERWRPPHPVEAWEEVRPATEFGPPCPQSPLIAMLSGEELPSTSEDCLYLNVWTAADDVDAQLPVFVWIHGGGLAGGWSSQGLHDGADLAGSGLVFVSINYRLGPLGFFSHPALAAEPGSENYGLLDQIAALQWVQRNIAAFGGDPGRVTIAGESAGGTSVLNLCASPLSQGLFQGAIAQSTWITHTNFLSAEEALGKGVGYEEILVEGAEPGSKEALAELRALPADQLWQKLGFRFEPALVLGGASLPEHPEAIFAAGRQHDVPLIVGTTRDEGAVFMTALPFGTVEAFQQGLRELYGEGADDVLALYPVTEPAELRPQINTLITDEWFVRGTRTMLRGTSRVSSPAWQYVFTRENQAMPQLGAHHAVELPYQFLKLGDASEADHALARTMFAYWVEFAKRGNPNGEDLPEWPAWEPETDMHLNLGVPISTGSSHRKEACDVLDSTRD